MSQQGQQVQCETCENIFEMDIKEEEHYSGKYSIGYFECPFCSRRYEGYKITSKGIALRNKLNKLRAKAKGGSFVHKNVNQEINTIEKKFLKEVTKL